MAICSPILRTNLMSFFIWKKGSWWQSCTAGWWHKVPVLPPFPQLYLCRSREDLVWGQLGATTIVKRQLSSPDWPLEHWSSAGPRAARDGSWGSQWMLRLGTFGTWLETYLPEAPTFALGSRTPSRWNLRLGQQGASVANSAPGLCSRSDYPRGRGEFEGWSSFQKQLSECRVASILSV